MFEIKLDFKGILVIFVQKRGVKLIEGVFKLMLLTNTVSPIVKLMHAFYKIATPIVL